MRKLEGVIPVLITPVDHDGNVDTSALEKLVDYITAKNIGGLWVLGTGAEDMNLTYDQRLTVVECVSQSNSRNTPLVVGAGFFSFQDSLNFLEDTKDCRFDAYHYMPYHNLLGLDRIEWAYKELAARANRPLWMYTSANWGKLIPPEFVESLKGSDNIAGIKFSTSNAAHSEKVIGLQDENFQVLTAVVRTFYASLCLGVQGATTVEACPYPDPIISIYELFKSGDLPGALKMQRKLNRFLEALPTAPGKDNFLKVAEGKHVLGKLDICDEYMSGYYRELFDAEKSEIDRLLAENRWAVPDIKNL